MSVTEGASYLRYEDVELLGRFRRLELAEWERKAAERWRPGRTAALLKTDAELLAMGATKASVNRLTRSGHMDKRRGLYRLTRLGRRRADG